MAPKKSARTSAAISDSLLDRARVSSAAGALPVHTRIAVLDKKNGWEAGLITQTWSSIGASGKPCILYKIAFDTGKEQDVDLSAKDAKLITTHSADTPRSQKRAASYSESLNARGGHDGPTVGVTNIPSPSKLSELKVPELRRMCQDLGLESKGAKKELIELLCRAHAAAAAMLSGGALLMQDAQKASDAPVTSADELASLHALVTSLRAELAGERAETTRARQAEAEHSLATASLEATLAERDAELQRANSSVSELTAALARKDSESASLRAQLDSCEGRELRLAAELQELKGNVRVVCRIRPAKVTTAAPVAEASGLMSSGIHRALTLRGLAPAGGARLASANDTPTKSGAVGAARTFDFDRVFGDTSNNDEVYEELRPLARAVADGSRATVLAYGQTGSGKTYTMLGMQTLAVQQVLDGLHKLNTGAKAGASPMQLRVAIVEVHNEKLCDLLDDDADKKLEIRQGKDGQPFVDGASWHGVPSAEQAAAYVEAAAKRRVTADNGLNERSSRSHLVMLYQVVHTLTDAAHLGQLALVDLAGSERLSRTEATGGLQLETAAINKSLSALGDVMTAIAAREAHVPFRNSKLTFLLQPALAKGSRVMFIVTASPDAVDAPETLISLGFGTRARTAQLGREQRAGGPPATVANTPGRLVTQSSAPSILPTTPGRGAPTTPGRGVLGKSPSGMLGKSPGGLLGKTPEASPRPHGSAVGGGGTKRPATPGSAMAQSAKRQLAEVALQAIN